MLSYTLFIIAYGADYWKRSCGTLCYSLKVAGASHGDVARVERPDMDACKDDDSDEDGAPQTVASDPFNMKSKKQKQRDAKKAAGKMKKKKNGGGAGMDMGTLLEIREIHEMLSALTGRKSDPVEQKAEEADGSATIKAEEDDTGWSPKDKESAKDIFSRYDFDESGTVNTFEEATQITTTLHHNFVSQSNRMHKPGAIVKSAQQLQELLAPLQHVGEDPMTFDAYWEWFKLHFPVDKVNAVEHLQ